MQTRNETPVENIVEKDSRLKKVGQAALTTGIFVMPVALTVVPAIFGWKTVSLNLKTAEINHATALLNAAK